MAAAATRSHVI